MDNTDGTTTLVRGNSTDAGNPLGPFQAPSIDFSWNLPDNRLPYSYTMDDPSQLKAIVTSPTAGAGAGVLAWVKTNWLHTSYPASAPVIVADPQSQAVAAGGSAVFVVVAGGSAPLTYQWYFNTNTPVSSATNATLTLTNAQAEDAGAYSVLVSNSVGFASSLSALLTVNPMASGFILWQTKQFTADQLNNPAISGPYATPAGDSVPNFVKYALGLAPLVPATQPLVSFRYDSGEGVLSYFRPVSVADVVYHVLTSTNLTDWTESGVVQEMVGPATNGLQAWEVRYSGPAATTRFFQLVLQP
jgi:hypothetical protein